MPERTASAHWEGTVREGKGTVGVESGLFDGAAYTFGARFETARDQPEELLGRARRLLHHVPVAAADKPAPPPDSKRRPR